MQGLHDLSGFWLRVVTRFRVFSESTLNSGLRLGFTTAVSDLAPRRNKACKNETAQQ